MREDDGPPVDYDVLDLYDLALLLNYERYTREPRFRRSMLVDVVRGGEDFSMFSESNRLSNWISPETRAERTGFMFKIEDLPFDEDQPDLPTDMLPTSIVPPRIQALSPLELETIFYQSRAHDACFSTIALLQYLFEHYDGLQPVCVRTNTGVEFITHMEYHHTATFMLRNPKSATVSVILNGNPTYHQESSGRTKMRLPRRTLVTGNKATMKHCAMVFVPPPEGSDLDRLSRGRVPRDNVVLDLASMQFGDAGRGLRGKSLFVLEPMETFKARMLTVAESADEPVTGGPMLESPKSIWLKEVARRAKERYDRREKEHWCGHCGAPAKRFACKCRAAWYCDSAHQKAAWPFHKHYCSSVKVGK
ncbi:hypothetical protein AURDEDRAFT_111861 [Auricularia subglabra TFB-10046 SS5]|nr:hypothetical protein AURDEDRAFT_111861 [Auricularia subglabra TFB-10046 SS5]